MEMVKTVKTAGLLMCVPVFLDRLAGAFGGSVSCLLLELAKGLHLRFGLFALTRREIRLRPQKMRTWLCRIGRAPTIGSRLR